MAKSTLRTLAVLGLVERVSFNGEEVKRHKIWGIYSTTVHSPLQPRKRTFTKALVTPGMGSGVEGMSGGWKKVAINNRDLYAHPARFPSLAKTNLPTIVLI